MLLCKSEVLRPYANAYLRVILVGAIPQMTMYAMNLFMTVDGSPRTVSKIAIGGNILNVCLDVVFMKYLGLGIAGAALATLTMYMVCTMLLLRHRFKGTHSVRYALFKSTNTDNCFYEFFRTGVDEVSEPLLLSELEEGASYCLIITNDAGIYRLYTDFQITVRKIKYDVVEITCSN